MSLTNSSQIVLSLNSPWYEFVKDGTKTFEGRSLKLDKIKNLKVGDIIFFKHHTIESNPEFSVKIVAIHKFTTFREALEILGLDNTLPGIGNVEEGVEIYHKFYKEETQLAYGVVMLEIKRLDF
jgi:ASC-1-like (ASCH) protein